MFQGTLALLENRGRNAIQEYRKAIDIVSDQSDVCNLLWYIFVLFWSVYQADEASIHWICQCVS